MDRINWERTAAMLICAAAGVVIAWLGLRAIFGFLLPFLLAWLLSLCITPLSQRLSEKLHLSQKLCSVGLLVLTLSFLVLLIGASINRLLHELQILLNRLLQSPALTDDMLSGNYDYVAHLSSGIGICEPFQTGERYVIFRTRLNEMLGKMLENTVSALSAQLPRAAGKLMSAMPSVLLFAAVTVISGFYFCSDRQGVEQMLIRHLPHSLQERLPHWRSRAKQLSWSYLRAYLLLLLLTFSELFLGLMILRVDYAFLLALLIAAIDILPVLGVGTVLLPWALIELIQKDLRMGLGLLILFLSVTVLRQIAEPKLLGKSLGLHPLITLAAGYIGWKTFGFLGMTVAPLLALLIKSLMLRRKEQGEL